ncbi:glucosamine-6-phosphate deaminase [Paenibacillus silvae]|jgi:glucosamine-6-phosphate deaminase|uniref:Glucosamine-6-phosphate deaminase n=1 Tax=Paenibacillus silvae TaxID=1325358 RepID=A0ABQ1ZHC2_9BACL|nr:MULTISPECIES: glucosamine-6-phosphate deaminase [Paenibacillus]MBU5355841.1 glucosamine-6-phosphate deaminase [Paenibacillus barcinonensis]MDM5275938.1 glucosamine-6-phosphate deaminase [Paenibacillus silvae]GGH61498.1 glucosamine-6-phosphate deaminase [Paenibacillus silvae]
MNIRIFENEEDLNATGAGLIASLLQTKPRAVLGLATGSSPVGIYKQLIAMYQKGLVSFAQASSFNLDEYVGLPTEHRESYRSFMNEQLFHHIDMDLSRTNVPNGEAADLAEECAGYERRLEDRGPVDLQLLGIGHNGHIGFNEPGTELTGRTHVVDLKEETRKANARFFDSIDEVPAQAITMGVGSILKAKQILLIARGEEKAEIIREAFMGPITTSCPASLLQCHPNVVVLLDRAAGRLVR